MWRNVSFSGGYDTDRRSLAGTASFNGGDVKLRADITNPISLTDNSLIVLSFSLEKSKSFTLNYQSPNKESRARSILGFKWARRRSRGCKGSLIPPPQGFSFHFMKEVRVMEKPLYYQTALSARLELDPAHKVSANCMFGSGDRDYKVKYTFVPDGVRNLESCFDLGKSSWDISFSQKLSNEEMLRASYESSSSKKVLGLEWLVESKMNSTGILKIKATFDMAKDLCMPRLSAESIWSFDL